MPTEPIIPGAGIEPAASTFRAWRHYQQQLPRSIAFGKEDSNLHRLIQSQGAYPLADSRAEGEGVEPSRLIARPISNRVPSPIGLPFRVSTRLDLTRLSVRLYCSPPLLLNCSICGRDAAKTSELPKKLTEHRVGLEPTLPHYGCGVFAARRPVRELEEGPEGLEPSPAWLRARGSASRALVPREIAVLSRKAWIGLEGIEPSSLGYQPSTLPLSYGPLLPGLYLSRSATRRIQIGSTRKTSLEGRWGRRDSNPHLPA